MSHHDESNIGVLLGRVGYLLSTLSPKERLLTVSLMETWAGEITEKGQEGIDVNMVYSDLPEHTIN